MPQLVEVRFKGNRKAYFEWPESEPLRPREPVVVESERGLDYGLVSAIGKVAEVKCERCQSCKLGGGERDSHGETAASEPTRRVVRRATAADTRTHTELRAQEDDARRRVRDRVVHHALQMKVSDAEWQWDRNKLTIYFTAERRVDFRALVRELASQFRTRIELRQIGVRDEAARLGGIGRCGRELCSSTWLPELVPIGLQVAKDQRLSLNPVQISGPCGRLLCCLRYEHEFYVKSRKRFPKEGKVLTTSRGAEKVWSIDIFRDQVTLRAEDGSQRIVPLAELKTETQGSITGEHVVATATAVAEVPPRSEPAAPRPGADAAPGADGPRRKRRRRRRRKGPGGQGPATPPPA